MPKDFSKVKTVGIVYVVPSERDFKIISSFVKFFQDQNKNVKALGFTNSDMVPHFCFPKLTYDYYTKKDLNWYNKPSSNFVDDFIKNEYDLMIDLTTSFEFSTRYIAYNSKSLFKVGKMNDKNLVHYDLLLDVTDDISLHDYTDHIKHYLTHINIKNE